MEGEDIGAKNKGKNANNGGVAGLVPPPPAQTISIEGIELMIKRLLGQSEIRQQTFIRESIG